jgi:hypothetical protein
MDSTARAKPTALLIANNALLLLLCIAAMTPLALSIKLRLDNLLADLPGDPVTPLYTFTSASMSLVAALQFAGTFFDNRRAATAAGLLCLLVAAATVLGAPQLMTGRPRGPELPAPAIAAVAVYAAACAAINLHRGQALSRSALHNS